MEDLKGPTHIWRNFFVATVETDRTNREATLVSLDVTNAKFPGVEDSLQLNKIEKGIEENRFRAAVVRIIC